MVSYTLEVSLTTHWEYLIYKSLPNRLSTQRAKNYDMLGDDLYALQPNVRLLRRIPKGILLLLGFLFASSSVGLGFLDILFRFSCFIRLTYSANTFASRISTLMSCVRQ